MKVYAEENESQKSRKIKPAELPIYDITSNIEYEVLPEEITPFRQNVSMFRKALWDFMKQFEDTTEIVKQKYEISKTHTNDALTYIQEDAGFLPRAIIITVAGMGGIVAGYRGKFFRKATFATIGMVTTAAICYPHQAVDISEVGWNQVKGEAKNLMRLTLTGKGSVSEKDSNSDVAMEKDKTVSLNSLSTVKVDKSQKDYGQSNKEDKDMYTTRGN